MNDTRPDLSGDWDLDPGHTRIGFSAKHAMVANVRGAFNDVTGSLHVDFDDTTKSTAEIVLKVASVDTRNTQRDDHLRSADFFDVEQFPEITFVSTDVSRDGDDWTIVGDLTVKGVSKPVTIEFESTGSARDPFGNLRVGFEGGTAISRKDWGLTWNAALETGGVLVSDKVKLEFDVSAIQVTP
jgi:polyisoprenoid-binding protein YceI